MAENLTVTESEIKAVCSYIKDDGLIAAYFGIARNRVELVRAKRVRKYVDRTTTVVPLRGPIPEQAEDRTPCPRCGVRRDIGCPHTAERLVA